MTHLANVTRTLVIAVLAITGLHSEAGVFYDAADPDRDAFIIVHPPGFDGSGGELVVTACVRESDLDLVGPLQDVIATWNALIPTTGNCTSTTGEPCSILGDDLPPPGVIPDAFTTLLHELGHCAMGLDHINWEEPTKLGPLCSNFTATQSATSITAGNDSVEGSNDDVVSPLPGSRIVHWFRNSDNNPVVIDGTVIDDATFTRARLELPDGHLWPASANREVAESLAVQETHSVMFSVADNDDRITGLTADEVNMVRFGMTGLDRLANTADDYTVRLRYIASCPDADLEIFRGTTDALGQCGAGLAPVPDPPNATRHFRLVPLSVRLDQAETWELGPSIFHDDFEEGDTASWNEQIP